MTTREDVLRDDIITDIKMRYSDELDDPIKSKLIDEYLNDFIKDMEFLEEDALAERTSSNPREEALQDEERKAISSMRDQF